MFVYKQTNAATSVWQAEAIYCRAEARLRGKGGRKIVLCLFTKKLMFFWGDETERQFSLKEN